MPQGSSWVVQQIFRQAIIIKEVGVIKHLGLGWVPGEMLAIKTFEQNILDPGRRLFAMFFFLLRIKCSTD